jgi:ligand-binding sensor domain-containing protein/serine phosphatase RsbU (regulator of sigma subunit)
MKKIFGLLLLILATLAASAQTTSFIYYGVEQGLSQSQVQCITQDDDGNLWIGTLSGLTKYNGRTFSTFSRNDSLAEDWVTAIWKDSKGNLLIGHWAGGVSMYNSRTKKIENLNLEEYTRFRRITSISQDDSGMYWLATEGSGIFTFDADKKRISTITKKDGLGSDNVYSLCKDQKGNMWAATDIGITVFDPASRASHSSLNTGNGLHSNRITTLALVNGSEMWVGSADAGVMVLDIRDNFIAKNAWSSISDQSLHIREGEGLEAGFINCILEDKSHNIWIGTTGGGISKLQPFRSASRHEALSKAIIKTYNTRQGLNYFNANAVFQDREGSVWIGTDIGLNQYRGERFQIYDEADSLSNNLVWTTLCDASGNIWLGTNDGITKISLHKDLATGKESKSVKTFGLRDGISSNVILSSFEDHAGDLWFGTGFGGVMRLRRNSSQFEIFNKADGLAGDVVFSICEDKDGNMWFGTKEGASKMDRNGGFRNFTVADGLGGNNVYRIFRDSKDNIWFGALGGALSMYDGNSFRIFDEKDGIRHRFILCINEDRQNNLWFGAYGGGLYKFDGNTFKNYTVKEGLTTDSPYSIIADAGNNIWIGSSRGLDRLEPESERFVHYGKSEGFPGVETNPNAVCADNEGNLWYGTIMGAVRYKPAEDKPNLMEPKTFISGLRLFMKDSPFPDDDRFSYDENHLTFCYVGVSLSNPEGVRYQYKLEGFDKDWLPGYTSSNEAVYTNLPPGSYTFMVRACNSDGTCNISPASYKFFIAPPFWQTAIFYIMATLFVVFSIYVFDKIRTRKLQQAKKTLEEKVEERTQELAVMNAELAEKNKDITDSIKYAKRIQEAILPADKKVRAYIPQCFIFSKPKDIVSGDFYWVDRKGDEIFFAAVDCTGHGVPGAFMSIVGHNLLDHAFTQASKVTPGQLLDELNKGISQTLDQSAEEHKLRDGMDIALCSLSTSRMTLQFAGAFNPLFLIRNGILLEYKADSIAIGSYNGSSEMTYTNHVIELQKGDMIYIFSDGYADQFGGPEGKKFKMNQFKQMLVNVHKFPLEQQRHVLEVSIEEWRGSHQQVDDILVIGVRV